MSEEKYTLDMSKKILMAAEKIIITGGTGYIGSHTVVELIDAGKEVVIADNLSNSSEDMIDRIEKITGKRPSFEKVNLDLEDEAMSFYEKYSDAAAVINFAAYKAVGESVDKPLEYYKNNMSILIHLLAAMKKYDIKNVIYSSSATVYGLPDHLPITESSPTKRGMNPYGNSKKIGEEIIADVIAAQPHLRAISLRYFNPIGAHSSGLIGELPKGIPTNLMPFITQTGIGRRDSLTVYGDDYDTPDGTAIRDYIHVVDLAKAHVITLDRMLTASMEDSYEVFNLGTGQGYSVLEVIESFQKTSGVELNWGYGPRRTGDVPVIYADPSLAKEKLGWQTTRDLDDMTSSAWMWEQNNRNG